MSSAYDNKVVEMRFDGKQFEAGVESSYNAITKLKDTLNFKDTAKGFEELERASGNVKLDGINSAVAAASKSFSAFEIVAISVLSNVANKAVDAGLKMAKSLTIDQVAAGWEQFGRKTTAVSTMMIATGRSIQDIEGVLDKIAWFADETSYSFSEMNDSVSKFVSNGIGLEDSVTAVQGIATWAAKAGQNSAAASRAMYNLSQAVSIGALKSQDWKSIELANMATEDFKQTAIETAKEMAAVDSEYAELFNNIGVTTANFRETLQTGWLNSDVLIKTLSKYGEYADYLYEHSDEYNTATEAMEALGSAGMDFGKEAFEAAQKARTLEDAINSVKDAAKTKFTQIFENMFGNAVFATETFTSLANDLWDVFVGPLDNLNSAIKMAFRPEPVEKFGDALTDAGFDIDSVREALKKVGIENGDFTEEMIKNTENLDEFLTGEWLTAEKYAEALAKSTEGAAGSLDAYIESVSKSWTSYQKNVWEKYMAEGRDIKDLAATGEGAIYQYDEWMYRDLGLNKELIQSLGNLTDEQKAYIEAVQNGTEDVLKYNEAAEAQLSGQEMLRESILGIVGIISRIQEIAGIAWGQIFPDYDGSKKAASIYNAMQTVYNGIKKVQDLLDLYEDEEGHWQRGSLFESLLVGFRSVARIAKVCGTAVSMAFAGIKAAIGDTAILDILSAASSAMALFADVLEVVFDEITAGFSNLNATLPFSLSTITSAIKVAIESLREWLNTGDRLRHGVRTIVTSFKNIATSVKNFVGKFVDFDAISEAVMQFVTSLRERFGDLRGFFNAVAESVGNIVRRISELGELSLENIIKAFQIISEEFVNLFPMVADLYNSLTKWFSGIGARVTAALNTISSKIGAFWNGVKTIADDAYSYLSSKWKDGTLNGILGILIGVGSGAVTVAILQKMAQALQLLATPIDMVASLIRGITGVLSELKADLKAMRFDIYMNGFKQIAIAILALAGAMFILASIDVNKLVLVSVIIGSFFAAIAFIVSKATAIDATKVQAIGKVAFAFAVALVALAVTFKILESIDAERVLPALGAMIIAVAMFGAVGFAMAYYSNKIPTESNTNAITKSLTALVIGFVAIAAALYILNRMNISNMWSLVGKMTLVMVALGALVALDVFTGSKRATEAKSGVGELGKTLLAIVAAVMILDKMSYKVIFSALGKIAIIELFMLGLAMIGNVGSNANADKAGKGISSMATTIVVLAGAMALLGKLEWDEIIKGAIGIGAIGLVMLAIGKALKVASSGGALSVGTATTFVAVAASIGALVFALITLSNLASDAEKLKAATNALKWVLAAMGAMILASSFGSSKTKLAGLAGAVVAVIAIATSLWVLTKVADGDTLLKASEAMLIVSAAVAAIGLILGMASKMGLGFDLGALAFLGEAIAGLVGIMAVFAVLAEAAYAIDPNMLDKIQTVASMIEVIFTSLGNAVGGLIGGALFKTLDGLANGLSSIVSSFSALKNADTADAANSLANVAYAISTLSTVKLGNIDSGKLEKTLSEVSDAIHSFFGKLSETNIDLDLVERSMSAVATIMDGINKLPKVGGIPGFLFGNAMDGDSLGSLLINIGTGLRLFANSINGISVEPDRLGSYMDLMKKMGDALKSLPNFGGLTGALSGNKIDAKQLKEYMDSFREAITDISSSLVDENGKKLVDNLDDVTKVVSIMEKLAKVLEKLPETAANLQFQLGNFAFTWKSGGSDYNSLAIFVKNISDVMSKIKQLSDYGGDSGTLNVAAINTVTRCLNTLADSMGYINGVKVGDTNQFATNVGYLASALSQFKDGIADIDQKEVTKSLTAANAINALGNALSNFYFAGVDQDIGSLFGVSLKTLVGVITDFNSVVKARDAYALNQKLTDIKTAFNSFAELNAKENSANLGDLTKTYGEFGSAISGLNDAVVKFSSGEIEKLSDKMATLLETLSPSTLSTISASLQQFSEALSFKSADGTESPILNIGSTVMENIVNGMKTKTKALSDAIAAVITEAFNNAITTVSSDAATAVGVSYMEGIRDELADAAAGVEFSSIGDSILDAIFLNGTGRAREAGRGIANAAKSGMASVDATSTGANFAKGFANGIRSQLDTIRSAGAEAGNAARQALENALDINSPSRVTYQIGEYSDQGLANGIRDNTGVVAAAAEYAGNKVIDSLRDVMSYVAAIFEQDIDVNPVISPILDLSNVETNARRINATVSNLRGVSVQASMDEASVGSGIQNGSTGGQIQYIQNNYSPKALSRIEIYRQTRNQLASMKGWR